jgi:hypothetical protein
MLINKNKNNLILRKKILFSQNQIRLNQFFHNIHCNNYYIRKDYYDNNLINILGTFLKS